MNYAHLATSPRLQRLLEVLSDGNEHTSMQLILDARVAALTAAVSELRANGAEIDAQCRRQAGGAVLWFYRLVKAPPPEAWEPPKVRRARFRLEPPVVDRA